MENKKKMRAVFAGHVQGVGFRMTTVRVAAKFAISGFVRNLEDGRVEVVAEGEEETLLEFLSAIRCSSLKYHIRDFDVEWSCAENHFRDFGIEFRKTI